MIALMTRLYVLSKMQKTGEKVRWVKEPIKKTFDLFFLITLIGFHKTYIEKNLNIYYCIWLGHQDSIQK